MADLTPQEHKKLLTHLQSLRTLSALKKDVEAQYKAETAATLPLLERVGSEMYTDFEGKTHIANVRQAESIVVDAGELYDALITQYEGDEDTAEAVWKDCLKPPVVDTAAEGRFLEQTKERTAEGLPARVSPETVAKVATFKQSAAFVGFAKPGG